MHKAQPKQQPVAKRTRSSKLSGTVLPAYGVKRASRRGRLGKPEKDSTTRVIRRARQWKSRPRHAEGRLRASLVREYIIKNDGESIHDAIEKGFDYQDSLKIFSEFDLSSVESANILGISGSTLQRRSKDGRLRRQESDRLYSFLLTLDSATNVFDSKPAIERWLKRPARALGNKCPIDMLNTTTGFNAVQNLLGQLEHGVFP